jgi:hypothetical protein
VYHLSTPANLTIIYVSKINGREIQNKNEQGLESTLVPQSPAINPHPPHCIPLHLKFCSLPASSLSACCSRSSCRKAMAAGKKGRVSLGCVLFFKREFLWSMVYFIALIMFFYGERDGHDNFLSWTARTRCRLRLHQPCYHKQSAKALQLQHL